jgi:hypothetical protein
MDRDRRVGTATKIKIWHVGFHWQCPPFTVLEKGCMRYGKKGFFFDTVLKVGSREWERIFLYPCCGLLPMGVSLEHRKKEKIFIFGCEFLP